MTLTKAQRETILAKIKSLVADKYFDPSFNEATWQEIVRRNHTAIIDAADTPSFDAAITRMLSELSPRTLGLLSDHTPIPPRSAINASFSVEPIGAGLRWVFQDVLPGGVAARAGVLPGDILLSAAGKSIRPASKDAAEPFFEMQRSIPIVVSRGNPPQDVSATLEIASPKYKDNPYSEPTALSAEFLPSGVAYLKVSLFPGKIGIDFANELDSIFSGKFANAERLIIDLRGNPGGGIGGLTLMSYLTPDRIPIGYSCNRKMAQERHDPGSLPVFNKIPRSKLAIPGLAIKFLGKTSVFVHTEGLARRAHHGRVAILVNRHTTGAAEMVAQFAQENRLAVIVGEKTPGRLVSRSAFKLGFGYHLVIPVAAYVSARGHRIEGLGITPDVVSPWCLSNARQDQDSQLQAALSRVTGVQWRGSSVKAI
jgi:C-terminal processing protease CtpA/Prc